MSRTLLLVESPNKAKKIQAFLGREGVTVRASVGHICDLPQKGYGVDLASFEESYEVRNAKVVGELRQLVRSKEFERVLLATDPDREGEAIAWHLARELKLSQRAPLRVEFREVTERAIRAAIAAPRPIDSARVDAQRSRRVLDRIVGFDVSGEICWPAGATSAGRVQTPALHILCEREREILAFVAETYWTLSADYLEGFRAFVPEDATKRDESEGGAESEEGVSTGDRDGTPSSLHAPPSGRLRPKHFRSQQDAEATRDRAAVHEHVVRDVQRRRTEKRPDPPYTTSTMQQDASRKLRLSAKQAADLAQSLFEAGYITYHRTDSTRVSDEAAAMARAHIAEVAPDALPRTAPKARGKAGAQDAHEAIRPTKLTGDGAPPAGTERLYAMIKARFLASQCKPAVFDRTTVWIDSGPVAWVAQGAVLVEPGFLHFWKPYSRQEDEELPAVRPGQVLGVRDYAIEEKQTTPPSRYDTGALIRKLEVSGIGRPATFASIIETLLKRGYVQELKAGKGKVFLQPTAFGLQVDGLLTESFPELVSEDYTASMEGELDRIERAAGETRVGFLTRWYADFRAAMQRALPRASAYRVAHSLSARGNLRGGTSGGGARGEETSLRCDRCGEADYRKIARKKGKGSFLACPACNMMRDVRARTKPNGCPKCGSTLIERRGRKKGVKFFGCVRYRAADRPCEYVDWNADGSADAKAPGAAPATLRRKKEGGAGSGEREERTTVATASLPFAPRSPLPPHSTPQRGRSATAAPSLTFTRSTTDKPCPRCGAPALSVLVPSDGGVPIYSCADRGSCGFTLPVGSRRRAAPCPRCGGVVLERRDDGGRPLWTCARAPGCDYRATMGS